ncbi:MAG: PAS domain-containing sensor histidine kinase [Gemmatimonadetes bacterium]|nr:PAS domain-containing sensor histidine kinase [Gemmatimonadota bacterium]
MDDPTTTPPREHSERPSDALDADDFRQLFRAGPTGCLLVDEEGVVRDLNRQAELLFDYGAEELIGQRIETLVPDRLRKRHARHRAAFARAPSLRPMGIGLELFARRRDGTELPVEIALSPVDTSRGPLVLVSINDITQRKRLRAFGAGVLQGAEEERQRIARDLHDDTAQALSALVLRLQMARRTEDGTRRDELLHEMHSEIRRTSEGVRRILRGLRPPALAEAGLTAAIRAQTRETLGEEGISARVDAGPVDELLDHEGNLALYRIVQEALSNVVRHADATKVVVSLQVEDGILRASVEDDGCGFAVEAEPASNGGRGLGIIGMQERATILGGSVRLESEAGRGTTVTVELPVPGAVP